MAVKAVTPQAFAEAILHYVKDEKAWQAASCSGQEAAARFTYSYYLRSGKADVPIKLMPLN